jgi:hypothetical protein
MTTLLSVVQATELSKEAEGRSALDLRVFEFSDQIDFGTELHKTKEIESGK